MTQKRVKASDVIGNSYYIYTLQSSNNTPSLNSTINITCNVTDVYGQAISGKSITLYQNNTSKGAKTTDSSGNASWNSISMSSAGLQVFKVENSKIEVFVDNKSDVGHTHSQYLTEHQSLSNYVTTDDSRLSDSRTPTSHTHGNLQNNGQIGSTAQANKNVVTNSSGLITTEDKPTIPSASTSTPSADTTSGSYGSGTTYARANHTHPKSSIYAEATHTHSQYLTEHQSLSNYVTTDDSRLSDSRTPTSHTHGNLQNNGQVGSTAQANKNVVTNSSGLITTEDKPTIPSASSTTPSADTTSGSVGTGTTWARSNHTHPKSSLYAESSHNHTKFQITDFPSIPSKTSDLQNDSGFLTSHQDISGKIDTAGTGLSKSGTTLNHSNSVTALTTASFKKVKYDSQGHITGTSDVSASDLPTHTHSQYLTSHQDITGKEDSSNKVSSWNSTTNNIRYPTEKLVKDSLDGKSDNGHTHSQYLTSHQDITGKEDKSNKVTSISSSSTDTQYPSAKLVYDELDNKLNSKVKATTTFLPQTYESGTNWNWTTPFKVTITNNGNLTLDFSPMFDKDDDRVYFNITTNQGISVHYDDTTLYTSTDTKSMYIIKADNNYILHLYNSDDFSNFDNYYTKTNPIITIATTTSNSTEISFGNKMWYHYVSYIDRVYPIGSIYMSVNSVDPTYFIGGTWERIQDTFLLASGSTYSAGSTGGSADAVLVSHNHETSTSGEYFVTSESDGANNTRVAYSSSGNRYVDGMTDNTTPFHHRVGTGYSGVSGTGKNMPPYLAVYMWKRIG